VLNLVGQIQNALWQYVINTQLSQVSDRQIFRVLDLTEAYQSLIEIPILSLEEIGQVTTSRAYSQE
jgi:hypothetical protein